MLRVDRDRDRAVEADEAVHTVRDVDRSRADATPVSATVRRPEQPTTRYRIHRFGAVGVDDQVRQEALREPMAALPAGLMLKEPSVHHAPAAPAVDGLRDAAIGARVHDCGSGGVNRQGGDPPPGLCGYVLPRAAAVAALEDVAPTARVEDLRVSRVDRERRNPTTVRTVRRTPTS